ncbi:MAG: DUF6737 family protein, partial [Cyanobacteria bacterium J06558_2]
MKLESTAKSTNVWDYKPKWCQPWSIIITGISLIAGSWLVVRLFWLTIAISLGIVAWWIYFLILYPQAFANYVASQSVN